jgi:hypothetical protein
MELPIDGRLLSFIVARTPEPLRRFGTTEPMTNGHGHVVYEVELMFLRDGRSQIFPVRTTTEPKGFAPWQAVTPVDLVASTWEMDRGFVLYAAAIETAIPMSGEAS